MNHPLFSRVLLLLGLLTPLVTAQAQDREAVIYVAVASNFTAPLKQLAQDFRHHSGVTIKISSASTGKLYAQILRGAPFDLFFAADEARIDRLIQDGQATQANSRVYALGRLVLVSHLDAPSPCHQALPGPQLKHLAIANPKTAPYGLAARQTLQRLNYWDTLSRRLVMGENIVQSLQFINTRSAQAGFVAKSLLGQNRDKLYACQWEVPARLHAPIKQKMALLKRALNNPDAQMFWDYMQSERAQQIIQPFGYDRPSSNP